MSETPKLLTEAEAEFICNKSPLEGVRMLRERGLIAPEPVDPLIEALDAMLRRRFLNPQPDVLADDASFLRSFFSQRGMELSARPLTREMVREALRDALRETDMLDRGDFDRPVSEGFRVRAEEIATDLHTALTEARDA